MIGDYPLYFRARGDSWSFTVVLVADANPDDLASWMRPIADGFFDYAGTPGYELTGRYGSSSMRATCHTTSRKN